MCNERNLTPIDEIVAGIPKTDTSPRPNSIENLAERDRAIKQVGN